MVACPISMPAHTSDPKTLAELRACFPNEVACAAYLEQLRWGAGFRCPKCGSERGWRTSDGRWSCAACGRKISVTAGTIFDRSRISLQKWFVAAWYVTDPEKGIDALGLQRLLRVGSYQSAWTMLQKFRTAMAQTRSEPLRGPVEVGAIDVGRCEQGVSERGTRTQLLVGIAFEALSQKKFGRVRLQHIQDLSSNSLVLFVRNAVEPGAAVHTDGWRVDSDLSEWGYSPSPTIPSSTGNRAHVSMSGVGRVGSMLRSSLLRTYQGSVTYAHLTSYLDEFAFRFNHRRTSDRGVRFRTLLEQAIATAPVRFRPSRRGKHE